LGLALTLLSFLVLLAHLMTFSSLIISKNRRQSQAKLDSLVKNKSTKNFTKYFLRLILTNKFFRTIHEIYVVLSNITVFYLTLYVVFAAFGVIISDIFYAFHLLDLIARNESLQNVVKSITLNGKSLILTSLLGALFIYYIAIWATIYLQGNFIDVDSNELCDDVFHCWQAMFNYGLLTGTGPVSSNQIGPPLYSNPNYVDRFIFDLIFFLILILIFLNVFFGIIIDTFGELRGQRKEKDANIKDICLICSIDRTTFDRQGNGFDYHTQIEHNSWFYLYFIVYIKTKQQSEFSGIEQYIYEKIIANDINWFPMSKSICLDAVAFTTDDESTIQVKLLTAKFDEMLKRQRRLENLINENVTRTGFQTEQ